MVYSSDHYGPEWFITKSKTDKKGLYVRASYGTDPLERPRFEYRKDQLDENWEWKKATTTRVRSIFKYIFKLAGKSKRL